MIRYLWKYTSTGFMNAKSLTMTQQQIKPTYYFVIPADEIYNVAIPAELGVLYKLGYQLSFIDLKAGDLNPHAKYYDELFAPLFSRIEDYLAGDDLKKVVDYLDGKTFKIVDIIIYVCDSHYLYLEEQDPR